MKRPYVYLNLAISLDGKISTADRKLHGFGGPEDRDLMDELRSQADAILLGGGTIREEDPAIFLRSEERVTKRLRENKPGQPLVIVLTPSLNLPGVDVSRFFQCETSRRLIVTRTGHDTAQLQSLRRYAEIWELAERESGLDLHELMERLFLHGVGRLLLEGGGLLNFSMLEANLVDELYLTLCPMLFGGSTAPTACEGPGFAWDAVPAFQLMSHRVGEQDRIYLNYRRLPNALECSAP